MSPGGHSDSFTVAVSHRGGNAAVLNALLEIRAPVNPRVPTKQASDFPKSYRLSARPARWSTPSRSALEALGARPLGEPNYVTW